MTTTLDFTFSDLIAGYVTYFDEEKDCFGLRTSDGREFDCNLSPMSYAKLLQNLDEAYPDATSSIRTMLSEEGRYVFAYGVFYPDKSSFDAKSLVFVGRKSNSYTFEKQNWWIDQAHSLA
ncbi:MAG: N-acyl-D-glucosamine 2-epimerase, partial [Cyanobacteria bacterium J06628_3]